MPALAWILTTGALQYRKPAMKVLLKKLPTILQAERVCISLKHTAYRLVKV
jgi:hypothetical protein